MQGLGYCYSILPALKEIYKDDPEGLNSSVKKHLQFFNTNQWMAGIILGVNLSIEEELKTSGQDAVVSIKAGLMGPFAGVGDTLFYTIIPTIFGSIAAYLALEGNMIGILLWLAVNILITGLRYFLFQLGYHEGTKIVENISTQIEDIKECASILGLTVVGALIPSVINVKIPSVFSFGEVTLAMQEMLDSIMPCLLPLVSVALIYWLLGKKKVNSTKAILIIVLVSVVLGGIGILGV